MTLEEWFNKQPLGSKQKMAEHLKISPSWLSQIINGRDVPSAGLTVLICQLTGNKVKRETLRPDLFGKIK
jgi:DNA-binding transcriptional regulator YdaS (Cro superfamily)